MRIAVIGGGPTAVSLLENLIRARETAGPVSLDVTVFDGSPHPWCGYSFAPDRSEALANTYASDMSVRHWQPEHADMWLTANGYPEFSGQNFAPRWLIGEYFKDSADQAISKLDGFALAREWVTKVAVVDDRVRVCTQKGSDTFDCAILSVGRSTIFDPYGLDGQEGFCPRPYPLADALRGVDPDENIGIIGSGLTAIDLTMALKADNHRGRITLLSRHGLLPAVRPPALKHELRYFTVQAIENIAAAKGRVTLEDLLPLHRKELEHAGMPHQAVAEEISPRDFGIDRLRRQLTQVDALGPAYSITIKMLLPAQDAWYFLEPQYKAVVAGFDHVYNSLCCPMPRHRASDILKLADSGQLDVVRDVRSVAKNGHGQFVATAAGRPPLIFDRVFSAGSAGNVLDPKATSLVDSLLRAGQARAHPFGGLDVDRTTSRLLDACGRPQPHLYAVGTTTSGAFRTLNGYSVLRLRAAHIADAIFENHAARRDRRQRHNRQPIAIVRAERGAPARVPFDAIFDVKALRDEGSEGLAS
ncbi:FAD/NAD(P)-binding protein [Ensifer aridi]|uniref:FAD/NAD(P)-binding protein n=1 Tax=Ensifer aridi TaxID=1708715 RepID=UPI00358F0C36